MGRPGGVGASRRSGGTRRAGGARNRPARAAKMFRSGHKDSAGEAGTNQRPRTGEGSLAAQGERSERPVAGTDETAQADQAGRHAARRLTACRHDRERRLGCSTLKAGLGARRPRGGHERGTCAMSATTSGPIVAQSILKAYATCEAARTGSTSDISPSGCSRRG